MSAENAALDVGPGSALTDDATLGAWTKNVRRARIGRERKNVALTVGSYANPDGTSVHCGVARLAVDCEIGYSTARRHLAWLRSVGLIRLTRAGNRKAGRADEYRLTFSAHTAELLQVPDDEEYSALIEAMNEANRKSQKARRMAYQRSPEASADTTDQAPASQPVSALSMVSAETRHQRSHATPSALTQVSPHLPVITSQPKTDLPFGGTLPPNPLRTPTPPAPGNEQRRSPAGPLTPAQDQQGESLPRTHASEGDTGNLQLVAANADPDPTQLELTSSSPPEAAKTAYTYAQDRQHHENRVAS